MGSALQRIMPVGQIEEVQVYKWLFAVDLLMAIVSHPSFDWIEVHYIATQHCLFSIIGFQANARDPTTPFEFCWLS